MSRKTKVALTAKVPTIRLGAQTDLGQEFRILIEFESVNNDIDLSDRMDILELMLKNALVNLEGIREFSKESFEETAPDKTIH